MASYFFQFLLFGYQLKDVMDIVDMGTAGGMNKYLGSQSRLADEKSRIHAKQVSNAKKKSGKGKLYKSLNRLCHECETTDFDKLIKQIAKNTDEYEDVDEKEISLVEDLFESTSEPIDIRKIYLGGGVVSFYMRDKGEIKRPVKRIKAILREIKKQQCN